MASRWQHELGKWFIARAKKQQEPELAEMQARSLAAVTGAADG